MYPTTLTKPVINRLKFRGRKFFFFFFYTVITDTAVFNSLFANIICNSDCAAFFCLNKGQHTIYSFYKLFLSELISFLINPDIFRLTTRETIINLRCFFLRIVINNLEFVQFMKSFYYLVWLPI